MRSKALLAAALAAGAWVAAPARAGDTIRLGGVGSLTASRDLGARVQNLDTKVGADTGQTAYHGGGHYHGGGGYHGGNRGFYGGYRGFYGGYRGFYGYRPYWGGYYWPRFDGGWGFGFGFGGYPYYYGYRPFYSAYYYPRVYAYAAPAYVSSAPYSYGVSTSTVVSPAVTTLGGTAVTTPATPQPLPAPS